MLKTAVLEFWFNSRLIKKSKFENKKLIEKIKILEFQKFYEFFSIKKFKTAVLSVDVLFWLFEGFFPYVNICCQNVARNFAFF